MLWLPWKQDKPSFNYSIIQYHASLKWQTCEKLGGAPQVGDLQPLVASTVGKKLYYENVLLSCTRVMKFSYQYIAIEWRCYQ